jgi:hypothetical protein
MLDAIAAADIRATPGYNPIPNQERPKPNGIAKNFCYQLVQESADGLPTLPLASNPEPGKSQPKRWQAPRTGRSNHVFSMTCRFMSARLLAAGDDVRPKIKNCRGTETPMFRWVIRQQLAGGPRPRLRKKPCSQVAKSTVDAWMKKAKAGYSISIHHLPA